MNTFNKMWGVFTPDEARKKIKEQVEEAGITEPKNLEEQAISMVGKDIYEKLIKDIQVSSGEDHAISYQVSLLSVCLSDLHMITIILMTNIRESRWVATRRLSRKCWLALK